MILGSIIIVTYGQRELTEQCLRSLELALGDKLGRTWELVLVDNDSPDDTRDLLAAWSDRATVLLLDENRNFSGGCNAGAAEAGGQVLVFLNNDTEVPPQALETLAEQALEEDVGMAGCRLLFPDGTIQHAGVAFLHGAALGGAAMPQHVFHHQDQGLAATQATFEADAVTAACMAVRADVFRDVGGFDEGYRNGLEDIDLCLKLRTAGHRIVYRGDVTVIHHEGASRGSGQQLWASEEKLATARHNDNLFVGRWAASLGQDDELAARVWDAGLMDLPPQRSGGVGDTVVVGQPSGIGSAADEARALIAAIAAAGGTPVAVDSPRPNVVAQPSGSIAAVLQEARTRTADLFAQQIFVPFGRHDSFHMGEQAIIRLASPHTTLPLASASAVWTHSPALRDALIADGLDPSVVEAVPPPTPSYPVGSGGAGVLMLIPSHQPKRAAALIRSLKALPRSLQVRILPSAHVRGLADELAKMLPQAELLGPCSDEIRFSQLAADADVVAAFDPSDSFERRALVAARAGSAVITDRADGSAAWLLGNEIVWATDNLNGLASRLADLAADPGARNERSQSVADACAWTSPPAPTRSAAGISVIDCRTDASQAHNWAPRRAEAVAISGAVAERPLVSVVIPAFNLGHFLPAAIDSVLRQPDPGGPVEVIVVDDGSTDDTSRILENHGDRIRHVRQANGGLVAAVDRGLGLAQGRYIALLDADDEMSPDRLRRQASALSMFPDTGLVHSDMELIDQHGTTLAPSFFADQSLETADGRALGRLLAQNFVSGGAAMFRRSLLPALYPIAPEAAYPDWWISVCAAAVAEIRLVPGIGTRYRYHGENMGLRAGPEAQRRIQLLELPWRRWMLQNLVEDDTVVAPELGWAANRLINGVREAFAVDPEATSLAAKPDDAGSWIGFTTAPPAGPGARRSRALLRALACNPLDASLVQHLQLALERELHLESPAPSPPLTSLQTRSRVTLAWLTEVLARPELLTAFAALSMKDEDQSLVILAAPGADLKPLVALFDADPRLNSESCDVTVIAEPATTPARNLLCARAQSCLTERNPAFPYSALPIHPAADLKASVGA